MAEAGGSAERKVAELRSSGDPSAGAWIAGAEGERRVAAALGQLPSGWVALHDRLLWPGVTDSNVDHIVVGPGGIFMIDAKNRGGDITVYRNFLYQHTVGPDGQKRSLNLQKELAKATWITQEMGRRLTVPVIPVICLAGSRSHKFEGPQFAQDITIISVTRLVSWLASQPLRMPEELQLYWIRRLLVEFPSASTDPRFLHLWAPRPIIHVPSHLRTSTRPVGARDQKNAWSALKLIMIFMFVVFGLPFVGLLLIATVAAFAGAR